MNANAEKEFANVARKQEYLGISMEVVYVETGNSLTVVGSPITIDEGFEDGGDL